MNEFVLRSKSLHSGLFFSLIAALSLGLFPGDLDAARLDAQVTRSSDRQPIEHVQVSLDLAPPDGTPELTTLTDPFGFIKFKDIPAGSYTLKAERLGFAPHEETVVFSGGDSRQASIQLVPLSVEVTFDIYFQVWGLATQAQLSGASVEIGYWEPDGDLSGGPDATFTRFTDAQGMVVFAGMKDGFYDFLASKTGWEPLVYTPPNNGSMVVSDGKARLVRSHFGSVYLRPVKQSMVVNVRGYDPVLNQANMPLKGISLTLTGVHPMTGAILLPPRNVVSGEDGSYEFNLLPPIDYRITANKSGYQGASILAKPKGDATFNPQTLDLVLQPTKVRAVLSSIYQSAAPYTNAVVMLQGIRGSATEGIDRMQMTSDDLTNQTASALFENLLPGRYWLYVNHESTLKDLETQQAPMAPPFAPLNSSPSSFHVKFRPREAYAEVGVATEEPVDIVLDPQPAVVKGKLYVTDTIGNLDRDPFFSEPNRVFRNAQQDGIEFWESKLVGLLTNQAAVVSVDTDAAGGFTALVIPGVFGVKIPTMTNYTGHNIEFGDLTEGEGPHHDEWPYSDLWPHSGFEFGHHGPGLRFDSGHEYQLDLFAHAHYINVLGAINPKEEPFSSLVLRMDANGDNEVAVLYDHLSESGATAVATGPVTRTGAVREDSYYLIRDVLPGTYSITIQHPDYTTQPVQVTIDPWEAPGIVPAVDPDGPTWFFPGITHDLQAQGVLEPTWNTTGSIRIERYTFDASLDPPAYRNNGSSRPGYFSMASMPGRLFTYNGNSGIPSGNYSVWLRHGDGWYTAQGSGSQTFDGAVEGGKADNTPPNAVPTDKRTFTMILKAVSESDPLMNIPDITVSFASGDNQLAGQTVAHNGSFSVNGATDPTGRWTYLFSRSEVLDPSNRVVQVTVLMSRNMTIQGTVKKNGEPISGAAVVVRNRYSGSVNEAVTGEDGVFSFGFLQPREFFLEVKRRGFITQRKRFVPDPSNMDFTVDFEMAPVPAPTIDTFTMNRFGLFLPGVSKAGDALGFNANAARPKITATWKASTTPSSFTESLDGFVQADDTPGPPQVRQIVDPIAEVWLLDRRAFTNSFVNDPNQIPHLQVDPSTHNLNFITMKAFLDEIVSGKKNGLNYIVYHRQVMAITNDVPDQHSGPIRLWELPSGGFSPRIVAITEHGGVAIMDYKLPPGKPPLQGLNLPNWASSFLQVIGNIAALGGGSREDEQEFPQNYVQTVGIDPNFQARIGLIPSTNAITDDSTLSYKYVMGVGLSVGEKSTAGGPTSLAPSFTGLKEVGLEAEFEVDGGSRKAILAIIKSKGVGVAEQTKLRNSSYVPAFMQQTGEPPKPSVGRDFGIKFNSSAKVAVFETVDTAGPFLTNVLSSFGLILEAQGTVDIFYRFNMSPFLGFIPYAGPVLVQADRTGALTIFGRFETTLGAKFTVEMETQYPKPLGMGTVERGTVLPEPEWSLLGQTKGDIQARLIFRLAAGMELSAFGGRLNGIVLLQLGAPTGASDVDGVFITLNLDGNYPLVKTVEGALSVVVRVSASWGPLSYSKNLQWDIARFIVDRNSTPSFDLFPMNVTFVQVSPATAPRETFFGSGSTLASDFYTAGHFELSSDGGLLVFTGIDPATGKMTVMASREDGGDWSAPLELTSAAGILSLATVPLPSGGWLAVWTEIDEASVGDPFPDSTLHYAMSNADGTSWSSPALLGSESGEAFDLKLVSLGGQVLLTYQCSIEGPFRDNSRLCFAVYAPGGWTAPAEFVTSTSLAEYDLAGDFQQKAHLAYSSREGEVRFLSFDTGTGWGGVSLVSTNSDGRIALAWNPTNQVNLLWQNREDSTELSQWTVGSSSWNHLGVVFTNTASKELELRQLNDGSQELLLASWIEGAANATIRHAYLDVSGGVLLEPRETVLESTGTFRGLRIRPEAASSHASILAVQTTATNNLVRRFQIGLPGPGDANGNGIPDQMEISMAMVQDQNTNGIPDSVEIADGQLEDRNRNGLPDLFEDAPEGDCNRNGLADSDEILLGLETDVNNNGILDSCEGISTRTVSILPQKLSEFYRGQRIIIRELRPREMVLEFEGGGLEKADSVDGVFQVVE